LAAVTSPLDEQTRAPRTIDPPMSAGDQAHRLNLELDADPDAIHGTREHGDGTRERFWGWLELMAALERATSRNQNQQDTQGDDERSPR
jgi:hypothetical protein